MMGSEKSNRLFGRQRTVHELLGGALVADVVLWRQKDVTFGILILTLAVWWVFEQSGYTLLSLTSTIFLLLISILFLWSKAASLLNRPPPPLPDVHLSHELVSELGELARIKINALISVCRDVALGKDSRFFLLVAAWLMLIAVIGGLTDIVSLCYISLLLLLTIPAIYEMFDDKIDGLLLCSYRFLQRIHVMFDNYITMLKKLDLEKMQ